VHWFFVMLTEIDSGATFVACEIADNRLIFPIAILLCVQFVLSFGVA